MATPETPTAELRPAGVLSVLALHEIDDRIRSPFDVEVREPHDIRPVRLPNNRRFAASGVVDADALERVIAVWKGDEALRKRPVSYAA